MYMYMYMYMYCNMSMLLIVLWCNVQEKSKVAKVERENKVLETELHNSKSKVRITHADRHLIYFTVHVFTTTVTTVTLFHCTCLYYYSNYCNSTYNSKTTYGIVCKIWMKWD